MVAIVDTPARAAPRPEARPEDVVLLRRVEAELALEAALGPDWRARLPARAAGAVELVRACPGGEALVEDALAGRPAGLRAALAPVDPRGLSPQLLHHLCALAEDAVARAKGLDEARRALEVLVGTWLELARDPTYLEGLAARVAGPTVDAATRTRIVSELALRGIDEADRIARAGVATRTDVGHAAVLVLRGVRGRVEQLGLPEPLAGRAVERARAALDVLAGRVIGQLRDGLDELRARAHEARDAAALFTEIARAWSWLGEEPEIERHVVTVLPDVAWPLYRARAMDGLREVITPVLPLVTALETRILAARGVGVLDRDLGFVAPCAQALVFWAECTPDLDEGVARAERAHRLCPTLRNARIVLAHLLCDRAEHTLARRVVLPAHPPRADVERAGQVFPELSRLRALRERVGLSG